MTSAETWRPVWRTRRHERLIRLQEKHPSLSRRFMQLQIRTVLPPNSSNKTVNLMCLTCVSTIYMWCYYITIILLMHWLFWFVFFFTCMWNVFKGKKSAPTLLSPTENTAPERIISSPTVTLWHHAASPCGVSDVGVKLTGSWNTTEPTRGTLHGADSGVRELANQSRPGICEGRALERPECCRGTAELQRWTE